MSLLPLPFASLEDSALEDFYLGDSALENSVLEHSALGDLKQRLLFSDFAGILFFTSKSKF